MIGANPERCARNSLVRILAAFDGTARAVRAAIAIRDQARGLGLEVRAGVHTGKVELVGGDVRGVAVHEAARIAAGAAPYAAIGST